MGASDAPLLKLPRESSLELKGGKVDGIIQDFAFHTGCFEKEAILGSQMQFDPATALPEMGISLVQGTGGWVGVGG